jgi:hypothetical protein
MMNENRLFCCCFLHFTNFGKIIGKIKRKQVSSTALFNGKWSLDQISVDRKFFQLWTVNRYLSFSLDQKFFQLWSLDQNFLGILKSFDLVKKDLKKFRF